MPEGLAVAGYVIPGLTRNRGNACRHSLAAPTRPKAEDDRNADQVRGGSIDPQGDVDEGAPNGLFAVAGLLRPTHMGLRWLPLVASSLHTCVGLHGTGLPLPSRA